MSSDHDKSEIDELMKNGRPPKSVLNVLKRDPKTMSCPDCGRKMYAAECCAIGDEWLFVCRDCKLTWTLEELVEMALDRIDAARPADTPIGSASGGQTDTQSTQSDEGR